MGIVLEFTHSAASDRPVAKSSAVTRLAVTKRKATAKSFDSHTFPRRNLETVVLSQETPASLSFAAIPSSSSPSRAMKSESFIVPNVHRVHNEVKRDRAWSVIEIQTDDVHNTHMASAKRKAVIAREGAPWGKNFLREWREHRELSLQEAGRKMGFSHSQLSRVERGLQPYSQDILEAASRVYSTSVYQILYAPPDLSPGDVLDTISRSLKVGQK
jgi:hypothetical protein